MFIVQLCQQNQLGAAWLSWVQTGVVGCSVAQLVVRWPAKRQARVRISARHPVEVEVPRESALWADSCEDMGMA